MGESAHMVDRCAAVKLLLAEGVRIRTPGTLPGAVVFKTTTRRLDPDSLEEPGGQRTSIPSNCGNFQKDVLSNTLVGDAQTAPIGRVTVRHEQLGMIERCALLGDARVG